MRLLHVYLALWLAVFVLFSREFLILNHRLKGTSFLDGVQNTGLLGDGAKGKALTTKAGGPLSFRLGWFGFGIICLTNLYILRKKWPVLRKVGKISGWLDFHIFCGLLGPTIIVFHTNFRVSGLVSVSFWCMMISLSSGVVGRYFYVQLLKERADLKKRLVTLDKMFRSLKGINGLELSKERLDQIKSRAYVYAGGTAAMLHGQDDLIRVAFMSFLGDLRLMFKGPPVPAGFPPPLKKPLAEYAVLRRRLASSTTFRKLLGYWHAFHRPFALFMYGITLIHIVSALVFRVDH